MKTIKKYAILLALSFIIFCGFYQLFTDRYDVYENNKLLYSEVRMMGETDFTVTFVTRSGKQITTTKTNLIFVKK